MALTYLGGLPLGAVVPLFKVSLGEFARNLLDEIKAIKGDIASLEGDIAGLQGDLAALTSDLASPQGVLDALLQQLALGPAAYIQGISAAISNILAGLTLAGLEQALTAGPTIFLQSIQAAIAEVTGKIAEIQARIGAVAARIAAIVARAAALAERIIALQALQAVVSEWQATLAAGGIHMYQFVGTVADLGAEVDGQLAGGAPGGSVDDVGAGFLILTTASGSIPALNKVFLP